MAKGLYWPRVAGEDWETEILRQRDGKHRVLLNREKPELRDTTVWNCESLRMSDWSDTPMLENRLCLLRCHMRVRKLRHIHSRPLRRRLESLNILILKG